MSAGLQHLLAQWYPRRDRGRWVLGTIYRTEGSCYRKAGAMMMVSDEGERLGLLSGGCLEADIARHAQHVMQAGGAKTIAYDSRDEGDVAYQLGLGCGGAVEIVLQCIGPGDRDLGLGAAHARMQAGEGGVLVIDVPTGRGEAAGMLLNDVPALLDSAGAGADGWTPRARLVERDGKRQLLVSFRPEPALLVVGGGLDARPVVAIASELGWSVTVCDPRPAYARARHFHSSARVVCAHPETLAGDSFDAAIVMSHALSIDAEALRWLSRQPRLGYLGLLGPATRRAQVLELSGVCRSDFTCALSGPAGLDLGGELPGDIALSILAQCQAALRGRIGDSGLRSSELSPPPEPCDRRD